MQLGEDGTECVRMDYVPVNSKTELRDNTGIQHIL